MIKLLTVQETEQYVKEKIGETTNPHLIWEIFKEFGEISIEQEDDVELLFQCGMDNGEFYMDFVRQFTVYDEDDYSHMEQLHCKLVYDAVPILEGLETIVWYFDTEGEIIEYFHQIEKLEEFKRPIELTPIRIHIYQEEV